jgi:pilus assembly protein Flp/PilA
MRNLTAKVKALLSRDREEGQGLVEYALILVLVSVVAIVALRTIGTNVSNILSTVASHLNPVG